MSRRVLKMNFHRIVSSLKGGRRGTECSPMVDKNHLTRKVIGKPGRRNSARGRLGRLGERRDVPFCGRLREGTTSFAFEIGVCQVSIAVLAERRIKSTSGDLPDFHWHCDVGLSVRSVRTEEFRWRSTQWRSSRCLLSLTFARSHSGVYAIRAPQIR